VAFSELLVCSEKVLFFFQVSQKIAFFGAFFLNFWFVQKKCFFSGNFSKKLPKKVPFLGLFS
jgi:hypothetical protein